MHPRLIDIATEIQGYQLILPSYFTMVTCGFIISLVLLRRWARANRLDPRLMVDFVLWMAVWGVLGSRLMHVIADGHFWDYVHVCTDPALVDWKIDINECRALSGAWDAARSVCHPTESNCWAWIDITAGGFAFYGGFIAAGLFSVWFVRRYKLPPGKVLDLGSWMLMLGVAWGRMGCFLASCCFGACTDSCLGVSFPGRSAVSRHHWDLGLLESYRSPSLPVHPTQLYEGLAALAIAAFAYLWLAPRKRFDGQVFVVASVLYAVARFAVEFLRRDERGIVWGVMSSSQLVALAFVVTCAWLWFFLSRRAKRILTG